MEFHSWYFSPSHESQRASVEPDGLTTHSLNELMSVQKDVEKKKNEFLGRLSRKSSISEREGSEETQTTPTSHNAENLESAAKGEKHAEDICKALEWLTLHRDAHESYLVKSIRSLENTYESLDASQPWLIYWIVHGMQLLEIDSETELQIDLVRYLEKCQNVRNSLDLGGFGGGPYQLSHLATTYGAINALCTIQSEYAYSIIDRQSLADWLTSLRREDGAFRLHRDGEVDVRGAYCALVAATLTGIYHPDATVTSTARSSSSVATSAAASEAAAGTDRGKQLFDKTAEWVASCQSFEGGFGGTPGLEAHGGYTFCALAALVLLNRTDLIDMRNLLRWLVHRQMRYEGGFQGRTNKLVDSCYSFWVGALFPLVHHVLSLRNDEALNRESWLFNRIALQEYVLVCCQRPRGGLLDKPGKRPDAYHTCYALSGLSVAQHFVTSLLERKRHASDAFIIGGSDMNTNILSRTSPIFNVDPAAAERMMLHFRDMPIK